MTRTALETWKDTALALPPRDFVLRQPAYVLIGEAHDLAPLCKKHWKTRYSKEQEVLEPGLDLAGNRLKASISEQLRTLAEAVQQAHSAYLLTTSSTDRGELVARGTFVVSELKAVLEWYLDDGVEDENDAKLARVVAEHSNHPETPDALAAELSDYGALAAELRKELDGLGGFDPALIEEASTLSRQILELPSDTRQEPGRVTTRNAIDLRNRLAWLLQQQMSVVRAAARRMARQEESQKTPVDPQEEKGSG